MYEHRQLVTAAGGDWRGIAAAIALASGPHDGRRFVISCAGAPAALIGEVVILMSFTCPPFNGWRPRDEIASRHAVTVS